MFLGGAHFEASFGPGRYRAFTCVDFKGDGYDLVSSSRLISLAILDLTNIIQGPPTEYGAWLADFPVKQTVTLTQLYTSSYCVDLDIAAC